MNRLKRIEALEGEFCQKAPPRLAVATIDTTGSVQFTHNGTKKDFQTKQQYQQWINKAYMIPPVTLYVEYV